MMGQRSPVSGARRAAWVVAAAVWVLSLAPGTGAQTPTPVTEYRVDATAPVPAAGPADYEPGTSVAPNASLLGARTIGVTDRYLTLDGRPWLPVMGELHYSRVPEAEWEDEILKMKSAGVNILSTYIVWIHHEEVKGEWDWSGQRDLHHFAELCRRHGMLLFVRVGPWAHAEVRNGGLPDWVMQAGPTRQLDSVFMSETAELYAQIARQLQGQLWKDGGAVIGVQLENEYAMRGPGKGADYILALKKLAVDHGMDVPLYTVTGWDNAVVPPHAVLPVYGGYPDAPWGGSRTPLPPQEVYAFRFGSRVSGSMGMIGVAAGAPTAGGADPAASSRTPFLTAEVGGGMADTYHRRPVVTAEDIASMMPVMIGSGVNLYGSYMFHGGENPPGRLSTLQESQATHYPTDVPQKSYDFQAPIGEFGQERRSLRVLKTWNYLLNDFGGLLAPMPAFAPALLPSSPTDLGPLRFSVRSDGRAGFLFVNNYVRGAAMPAHLHAQFAISLPGGMLRLPAEPIDLPSGAFFAWPFHLDLEGVPLLYSTAQLMARLAPEPGTSGAASRGVGSTFVFACVEGVRCELAIAGTAPAGLELPAGITSSTRDGVTTVVVQHASPDPAPMRVRSAGGTEVSLLLLSAAQAEDSWKVRLDGAERLLRTHADVIADQAAGTVTLRSREGPGFAFALQPAPAAVPAAAPRTAQPLQQAGPASYRASLPPISVRLVTSQQQAPGEAPPIALGPAFSWRPGGVATVPADAAWNAAAGKWTLRLEPTALPPGVRDLFLNIRYTGDQARLLAGSTLLDDDFFNGTAWQVGLRRYTSAGKVPLLLLEVLPLRADSPVYLEPWAREAVGGAAQTAVVAGFTLTPEYELRLGVQGTGPGQRSAGAASEIGKATAKAEAGANASRVR